MGGAASIKDAHVLIVEDEYLIADDLARALRKAGGIPVGPVSTLGQAEDILKQKRVDAAILDLNLRGEMASRLIERLIERKLPCLIVSGYGEDGLPDDLRKVPRLEKPISTGIVVRKLAEELTVAR